MEMKLTVEQFYYMVVAFDMDLVYNYKVLFTGADCDLFSKLDSFKDYYVQDFSLSRRSNGSPYLDVTIMKISDLLK